MARPVSVQPVNFALIRHVAKQRGMLLKDLAAAAGIGNSQLSEMLNGLRKMNDEKIANISEVLGVPDNYFRTPLGRMVLQKTEADLVDFALTQDRHDVRELDSYLDVASRIGHIDFAPEIMTDDGTVMDWAFWKKDDILPFRSENCIKFWEFDGDEIIIRGPARCGKSTLILEWLITLMLQHRGMQVMIARAFGVDLDAVRQNIKDLVKYQFADPLSSIRVEGGSKFHTVHINGGQIELRGIDRPGGQLGAGYDVVIFSQAEQIKKENVDVISSRCTPASRNWIEDGTPRSMIIYDVNPNRIDHWLETAIKKGVKKLDFDFADHPGYFTEAGEETDLYRSVHARLDRLEGVWRQRLLEGKAANPEGTIFELKSCHLLEKLPDDFATTQTFYRGFDFGMKDPNVCLWFGVHRVTGDVTVFREWRKTNVDTIEMGEEVKKYTKERVIATVIDNDENLQSILQKNCGIPTHLAQKGPNSIASGIALTQHRLKLAEQGEPGGLYFYNNPVVRDPALVRENEPLTILDEAELYAWHDNIDKPIDKYNHGWDVVRYVLDYLETRQPAVGFAGGGVKRKPRL